MVAIKSYDEYKEAYSQSIEDPETFWGGIAEQFTWRKKWEKVLEWDFTRPDVNWFINGKLNITENCIDRHLVEFGDRPAIVWEPNGKEEQHRVITYRELIKKTILATLAIEQWGKKR